MNQMHEARKVLIEGWRFLSHSYAAVNQFQCLELLKHPNIALYHRDSPFFRPTWRPLVGLFNPDEEDSLRRIQPLDNLAADACFRIAYPYNFSPPTAARTVVFGTCEHGVIPVGSIVGAASLTEALKDPAFLVATPSRWSAQGFLEAGVAESRLAVIPHGVDTARFYPLEAQQRDIFRREAGLDGFVILSVGSMTSNKGLIHLLKGFAALLETHPHARLVLKGADNLYPSRQLLLDTAKLLTQGEMTRLQPRLHYFGDPCSYSEMARFYQMSDAYVAPYLAEGFNMPVLEASACGLPVICTGGGATDDFTRDDFAMRIGSQAKTVTLAPGVTGKELQPDQDHLIELMRHVINAPSFSARALKAGPEFVRGHYTWTHVVDQLLDTLFPSLK